MRLKYKSGFKTETGFSLYEQDGRAHAVGEDWSYGGRKKVPEIAELVTKSAI